MSKIIGLLLLTLTISGCDEIQAVRAKQDPKGFMAHTFDGCEYVYTMASGGIEAICHKGNCKNVLHEVKSV